MTIESQRSFFLKERKDTPVVLQWNTGLDSRSWGHDTENPLNFLSFQILQPQDHALERVPQEGRHSRDLSSLLHLGFILGRNRKGEVLPSAFLCICPPTRAEELNCKPQDLVLASLPWGTMHRQGWVHSRHTRNIWLRGPFLKSSPRLSVESHQFLPQKLVPEFPRRQKVVTLSFKF